MACAMTFAAPITGRRRHRLLLIVAIVLSASSGLFAADPDLAGLTRQLRSGEYEACITGAADAIDRRAFGEDWYLVKAEAELAIGQAAASLETIQAGLQRYSWSIRLRHRGIPAARAAKLAQQAAIWHSEILDQAGRAPWRYVDADNLVALGRTALAAGIDAKQILEQLYDRALKQSPQHRDALLASGDLALAKQDYELAAQTFRTALKHHDNDPDLLYGLACSLQHSDPARAAGAIAQALGENPRHLPSLLFRAEHALDAEHYADAGEMLEKAQEINPLEPDIWAYLSIIATLSNDPRGAETYRERGLSSWAENPRVDYLIGKKLSQKYRFAEGAEHQRIALRLEPAYLPAKTQLTQDLLRLGRDDEAWKLAQSVHETDGYDVMVFNLLELRDKLAKYTTIDKDGFRIRMETKEAAIYGDDVLALLTQARQTLCQKYGLDLKDTVTVEIFPEPSDFAVRTFGLPGASGYLGVCFGRVITANSPASQAEHPANWQAVLWHEFCHVVTLELTKNRMPRWLSEGISVYEERLADSAWGERMNPRYREWILSGRLTPLDEMSGAFLSPESPLHLQFAYYQASLVVQFLTEVYGSDKLRYVLSDLSAGLPVEIALERRLAPVRQLDQEFRDYAREIANRFGPDLDWEQHDLSAIISDDDPQRLERWLADHPTSVVGLTAQVQHLLHDRNWEQAEAPLKKLIEAAPDFTGAGSFYDLLATVYREQGNTAAERRILEAYLPRADADISAMMRLIELQRDAGDWPAVLATAERLKAVNPLLPALHLHLSQAAEAAGRDDAAMAAWQARLALGENDQAEAHYRLAKLMHRRNDPRAKRELLKALEIAPRFKAAQVLLLEMVDAEPKSDKPSPKPEAVTKPKSATGF
jgi:tetratricopeptide (TPR) repeat protein